MRLKILCLILVVMLVLGIAIRSYAEVTFVRGPDARISIEVVNPESQNPQLSTTITTNNRVLGFTYSDSGAGGAYLADYNSEAVDSTTLAAIKAARFGEAYVAAGETVTIMFPMPKSLSSGLVVGINTTTGAVMVYYE